MSMKIDCFKAYDARGKVPDQLNADIAYRIGRAFSDFIKPKKVAVGRDVRLSSDELFTALCKGLTDAGVEVLDLGLCGTEEVYFAAFHLELDGGIMITASHNPIDYNGFKFVRKSAKPISADSGLKDIQRIAEIGEFEQAKQKGMITPTNLNTEYVAHLLKYVGDIKALKPLKIITNAGNGMAGASIDLLEKHLPFEFIKIQHDADGHFPNGIPNPLLVENRKPTTDAIKQHNADLAIAWDGDFDRCFFFDHNGRFIEGYYIVGLLAAQLLQGRPGSKIVHDPRLTWNTREIVEQAKGVSVQSKAGHAFIKETMREVDAIYGGEMSAHHFFKDFGYCDSGMVPWLLLTQMMSSQNKSLAELVDERIERYPVSGEINLQVSDTSIVMQKVEQHYLSLPHEIERIDGLGMDFGEWRFNLRASNTEPLIRLNVESKANQALMQQKTDEILDIIKASE